MSQPSEKVILHLVESSGALIATAQCLVAEGRTKIRAKEMCKLSSTDLYIEAVKRGTTWSEMRAAFANDLRVALSILEGKETA